MKYKKGHTAEEKHQNFKNSDFIFSNEYNSTRFTLSFTLPLNRVFFPFNTSSMFHIAFQRVNSQKLCLFSRDILRGCLAMLGHCGCRQA